MLDQIPNFPQAFMDRHMTWHTAPPPAGRTVPQGQPGSGAEFLDFHHQFVADVKTWYAGQPGADPSRLLAWTGFPADLAAAHNPELADYEAYASTASNFTTEDALGIYVEHEHNTVHGMIADFYDTPEFAQYDSCMFFMFYQWHGMIDAWRGNWLVHHKLAIKDAIDGGGSKLLRDKAHVLDKVRKEIILEVGVKQIRDVVKAVELPPKSPKEMVEVPPGISLGDPAVVELIDRMAQLESVVHQRAFIRKEQRPEVR